MLTVSRTLFAPKEGNTDAQYEDAFAVCDAALPTRLTIAVSDGASSAGYAREWANLLAGHFATDGALPADEGALLNRVLALGMQWRASVSGGATSWYAQEKLEGGSAATLLVARFDTEAKQLEAFCVGDVCLFLVRNNRLRFGFPNSRAAQFSNHPDLLSTEPVGTRQAPRLHRFSTVIEPGDRCFICTDALAQYFLTRFETKREKPWQELPRSQEELAAWLAPKRDFGAIKNDDVTLLEVAYTAPA